MCMRSTGARTYACMCMRSTGARTYVCTCMRSTGARTYACTYMRVLVRLEAHHLIATGAQLALSALHSVHQPLLLGA